MLGRVIVPVIFILLLPVAFAASVKDDDATDNAFTFSYDAVHDEMVTAASSKHVKLDDDVDFTVFVTERNGNAPLLGRVRFGLLEDKGVRYRGTVRFRIMRDSGGTAYEDTQSVSFTLRPKGGQRTHNLKFPFDLPDSGDYSVEVTFGR
jgi:hypothetical protein